MRQPRMRDDGEFALIARLRERLGGASSPKSRPTEARIGIGDDAALTAADGVTATSVDAFVEGVHFRLELASPRSIGRKALAGALSDLAAMGASPGEAYLALGISDALDEDACVELYDGVSEAASESGTTVLGGDVTRSPVAFVAVTVVGHAPSADATVPRDGASAGELVAVTGELGGAAAGLLVLEREQLARSLDVDTAASLRQRQLEPEPRLSAGAALATAGATAMIDVSDGLGSDAAQLAAASGVGIALALERLPIQRGVAEVSAAAGLDPHDLAAAGGEDYELLAALPESRVAAAAEAVERTGTALTVIGRTTSGHGVTIVAADGSTRSPSGFDHLRTRRAGGGRG